MSGPTPTLDALRQCVASTHSPGSSVVFARVSDAGTFLSGPLAMHDGDRETAVPSLLAEVAALESALAELLAASNGGLLTQTILRMRQLTAMQVFVDSVRPERLTPASVAALVVLDAELKAARGPS